MVWKGTNWEHKIISSKGRDEILSHMEATVYTKSRYNISAPTTLTELN
jgi:hypothetical protein